MKIKTVFLIIPLTFILTGCEGWLNNSDVQRYIDLLKAGKYNSPELPEFQPSDITALLVYRDDTTSISNFPRNGISSLWLGKCRLGIYVLWTIESIRAVETNSKYLIGRFPSQNPVLASRSDPGDLVFNDESHKAAARAYYSWWRTRTFFRDKMKIDPLEDTDYQWH